MRKTFSFVAQELKLVAPTGQPPKSQGIFYIKFEADPREPKNLLISYQLTNGGATQIRSTQAFKMFIGDFEEEGRITQRSLEISWQKLKQELVANSKGPTDNFAKTFFLKKNFQYLWTEVFFPFFEAPVSEKVHFKKFLKYNVEALEVYLMDLNLPRAASFFLAASTLLDEFEGNSAEQLIAKAQYSSDGLIKDVLEVIDAGFKEFNISASSLDSFNAVLNEMDKVDAAKIKEKEEKIEEDIEGVTGALEGRENPATTELAEKIKELAKDIPTNARDLKAALLLAWSYVLETEAMLMCECAIHCLDHFIKPDANIKPRDPEAIKEELEVEEKISEKDKKASVTKIAKLEPGEMEFLQALLPDKFEEVTLSLTLDTETLRAFEQVIHEQEGATTEELAALEKQENISTAKLKIDKAQLINFLQNGITVGEGVEIFYGPYEVSQHLPGTVLPLSIVKGIVNGNGTAK